MLGACGDVRVDSPPVGTVELFTELPVNTEGIATASDATGSAGLYVTSPQSDAVYHIAPDGTFTLLANLLSPLGIARTRAGTLLVCAKSLDASANERGAVYELTTAGVASIMIDGDVIG